MAAKWEKLLYIKGGKLELSKYFWLPITWKWRKGEPIVIGKNTQGFNMKLTLQKVVV